MWRREEEQESFYCNKKTKIAIHKIAVGGSWGGRTEGNGFSEREEPEDFTGNFADYVTGINCFCAFEE